MIKFAILGSSSSGNSVFVQVDDTQILLDCGFSFKKTKQKLATLGKNIDEIQAVFISHAHGDHYRGLHLLEKNNHTLSIYNDFSGKENPNMCHGKTIIFGSAAIIPIKMDHDVPCFGFVVIDRQGNKLAYITDTDTIPCESLEYLIGCQAIIVEANHDTETLLESSYPTDTKHRAFNTHLRNEQMADLLRLVAWGGLEIVALYHLSVVANNPKLAEYEARSALDAYGCGGCRVVVADKNEVSELLVVI